MTIDYKLLLSKYMLHVATEEGTTFVHHLPGEVEFTADELAELEAIEEDLAVNDWTVA